MIEFFKKEKLFVCYIWFTGWNHISLGLHLYWSLPNIEIHLPFCFLRIGWEWFNGSPLIKIAKYRFGFQNKFPKRRKMKD